MATEVNAVPVEFLSKEEQAAAVSAKANFAFDPEIPDPFVAVIQGEEGTGKTRLACTASSLGLPMYIADTEQRAKLVAYKMGVKNVFVVRDWMKLYTSVKAIIDNPAKFPVGIMVFDSGTDLQKFAEFRHLAETGKEKVGKPFQWGEVFVKIEIIFNMVKSAGFSIIITSRMGDEYNASQEKTGNKVAKLYSGFPYKADLIVQLNKDKSKHIKKPIYGEAGGKIYGPTEDVDLPTLLRLAKIIP